MNSTTHINKIDLLSSIDTLDSFLGKAELKITFWGARKITLAGFKGSLSIDHLANKVHRASTKCAEESTPNFQERIQGLDLCNKINGLYKKYDVEIQKRNWITRLLAKFFNSEFLPYTDRFWFEDEAHSNFRSFSKEEYLKHFSNEKKPDGFFRDSDGESMGRIYRISVQEKVLRTFKV